jgi:predicted negative regulator of RcsB-dependent stress response
MATRKTPNKKTASKKKQTKKVASTTAANVESEGVVIDKLNAVLAWIKRNPAPFLLIVTLLIGLLWFGYVSYVKWQFSQAEKEVGRLSTAIIDELGTPQSTDTLKSCSYKSEKYAYGQTDAMCSVRTLLTYDVDNANEALEKSDIIKQTTEYQNELATLSRVQIFQKTAVSLKWIGQRTSFHIKLLVVIHG